MRGVVGLYLNPPETVIVLCVDEKSQIQTLNRTAPILPLREGLPEKAIHDYKRRTKTADEILPRAAPKRSSDARH